MRWHMLRGELALRLLAEKRARRERRGRLSTAASTTAAALTLAPPAAGLGCGRGRERDVEHTRGERRRRPAGLDRCSRRFKEGLLPGRCVAAGAALRCLLGELDKGRVLARDRRSRGGGRRQSRPLLAIPARAARPAALGLRRSQRLLPLRGRGVGGVGSAWQHRARIAQSARRLQGTPRSSGQTHVESLFALISQRRRLPDVALVLASRVLLLLPTGARLAAGLLARRARPPTAVARPAAAA